MAQTQGVVNPVWEEMKYGQAADADGIRVIRPIDKEAAIDHHPENGEIEPMEPAGGEFMLFYEYLHGLVNPPLPQFIPPNW